MFAGADPLPGERVLDIGCGCGETTIAAARAVAGTGAGPRGFALGLDLSSPMLAVAGGLATRANLANIGFVRCDAQACPLRHASFDVVVSCFGVMFFDSPAQAFARFHRVANHGGRLAFLCWRHEMHNELLGIPQQALGRFSPPPAPSAAEIFVDPARLTGLLMGAGWEGIAVKEVSDQVHMGSDVPDVMSYVCGMPMFASRLRDLPDEALRAQVLAAMTEQYAARQRPDGVWVRAAAWLVTARRG